MWLESVVMNLFLVNFSPGLSFISSSCGGACFGDRRNAEGLGGLQTRRPLSGSQLSTSVRGQKLNCDTFILVFYSRGSQPFDTCVPPNQTQTLLRTPNSEYKPSAYPQIRI